MPSRPRHPAHRPPSSSPQRIETEPLSWTQTDQPGVERKPLAEAVGRGFEVQLVRLAPGVRFRPPHDVGFELLVSQGAVELPEGALSVGGYTRRARRAACEVASPTGATILLRRGPMDDDEPPVILAEADQDAWVPGQGGLTVRPLQSGGTESTALVHWPAGERFIPHRHYGGEEIFVLSGTFEDEHGRYPAGTWLLSPHLSAHHPFVREETMIFVKTGHLVPRASAITPRVR
ncbi:MAG: cupin domain-containing protein [Planctomycetota bacterium]